MKAVVFASLLLLATVVQGFTAPQTQFSRNVGVSMSASVQAQSFVKGPRVVMDELPTVFVYDHCPFCVRVRLALGLKNIKHTVHFMANDDIPTPTKLVGKKVAPIFVSPGKYVLPRFSLPVSADQTVHRNSLPTIL